MEKQDHRVVPQDDEGSSLSSSSSSHGDVAASNVKITTSGAEQGTPLAAETRSEKVPTPPLEIEKNNEFQAAKAAVKKQSQKKDVTKKKSSRESKVERNTRSRARERKKVDQARKGDSKKSRDAEKERERERERRTEADKERQRRLSISSLTSGSDSESSDERSKKKSIAKRRISSVSSSSSHSDSSDSSDEENRRRGNAKRSPKKRRDSSDSDDASRDRRRRSRAAAAERRRSREREPRRGDSDSSDDDLASASPRAREPFDDTDAMMPARMSIDYPDYATLSPTVALERRPGWIEDVADPIIFGKKEKFDDSILDDALTYDNTEESDLRSASSGFMSEEPSLEERDELSPVQSQEQQRPKHGRHTHRPSSSSTRPTSSPADYKIIVANTSLFVAFTWADPTHAALHKFLNPLLRRTIVDRNHVQHYVWRVSTSRPPQVAQLGNDSVWRLEVSPAIMDLFFENPQLEAFGMNEAMRHQKYLKQVKVVGVTLTAMPLGTAILQYHFDWIPKQSPTRAGDRMDLDEFRSWLHVVKFRQSVPDVFSGWKLGPRKSIPDWDSKFSPRHISSLGSKTCAVIYENKPISISQLSNWLLAHPEDDLDNPTPSVGDEKRAYHHSSVVISARMHSNDLRQYLFQIKRSHGISNRTPAAGMRMERVMQLRQNRFIGISREGTVSLSWPSTKAHDDFEVVGWPLHFHTIYRVLAVFVQGERSTLSELSHLSALAGEKIRLVTGERSLKDMAKGREELFSLVTLMARYTLQMSSDECGGLSDYVEFFSGCRKVFSIKSTRDELQSELTDVLRIVESNFFLEERAERKRLRKEAEQKETRRKYFDLLVGLLTAITLPLMLIAGIFGMNNFDVPLDVPYWALLLGAVGVSLIFIIVFVIVSSPWTACFRVVKKSQKASKRKTTQFASRMSLYVRRPFNRNSIADERETEVLLNSYEKPSE